MDDVNNFCHCKVIMISMDSNTEQIKSFYWQLSIETVAYFMSRSLSDRHNQWSTIVSSGE